MLAANAGGPYTGTSGQALSFDGSKSTVPTGQTLSYAWSFGDGGTATGVSPTHSYATAGTYTVTLVVTSSAGGSNTATGTATITTAIPLAANAGGPYTGTSGQALSFDGSKSTVPTGQTLSYAWSFGDGGTATGVSPTHSYATAGTYTVTLVVTSSAGGSNTATGTATITTAIPLAANAGGPYTGTSGQALSFDGSKSTVPTGQTLSYAWSFGDGGTATGVSPTHSYATAGTYTVTLVVTSSAGGSNTATGTATITTAIPLAANAGGPYTGTSGQALSFDGSKSTVPTGQTLSYAWSFGDGGTATGVSPTHSYATAGTYTVTLVVTSSAGGSNTATGTATITTAIPLAANAGGPYTGTSGQALSFDGSKSTVPTGQTLSYAWSFGDGGTATGVSPTHSYATAGTYTVTLVVTSSAGGSNTATGMATITPPPPPTISEFSPATGPIGTVVTLSGNNLAAPSGILPDVTLNQQGGSTLRAPVSTSTSTSISFVIPPGAATGPIALTVGTLSVTSVNALAITTSSTFKVSVTPGAGTIIQGQSAALSVMVNSVNGFSGLATLTVTGQPSGVTATFQPSAITDGQIAVLTLSSPASQPVSTSTLTVSASASIDGQVISQSASASLTITAADTSFLGRTVVDDAQNTPIGGVTVKFLGKDDKGHITGCSGMTTSDGAGNFLLSHLASACIGPQLVSYDGSTATSPAGKYAGVNLSYTLASGQVTTSPVLVHLPRIDNAETVQVQQNSLKDQVFTFSSIPGLAVTVYAGTTFSLDNGTQPNPFPLVAITIPIDRLPEAIPTSGMLMPFIVAFQPANAVSSQPVAVDFPNTLNLVPGSAATFSTLDPTRGYMVPYGTGTVSADGTKFLADPDPAHSGHRYGLVHFDWHGPTLPQLSAINPAPPPVVCPLTCTRPSLLSTLTDLTVDILGASALIGKPVDLSSGLEVLTSTDISVAGSRGSMEIVRTYRSFSNINGPFGFGTNMNYGYQLDTATIGSGLGVIGLVAPDGGEYYLGSQGSGTWANNGVPFLTGAVMTNPSGGVYDLKWKDGTVWQFQSPASSGREAFLTSITDANGNTTTMSVQQKYSTGGVLGVQINKITDPVGRSLQISYNGDNHISSIIDPIGRRVSYGYDGVTSQLTSFTDVNGGVTKYEYNQSTVTAAARAVPAAGGAALVIEDLSKVTDARGVVIAQNTYDSNHRVVKQIEADGGVYTFSYTLQNPMVGTSPVSQTDVTDPLGRMISYRFDSNQLLTSVVDSSRQTTTFGRDGGSGNAVSSVTGTARCGVCGNPVGGDMTYIHDGAGNLLSETDASGATTSYTYDPIFNKVISITDPLGNISTFRYDSKGNLASQQDPNLNTTSFTYNSYGQVVQISNALGQVSTLTYDNFGNVASITNPLKNTSAIQYDDISRPTKVTDALQRSSSSTYDNLGRVLAQTNAQGNITKFSYDANGNLTSLTDANGHITSFTYDVLNRLLKRTDPAGKSDSRTYDFDGNLKQYVDRRGQTSSYTYDVLNRLTGEAYSDSSVTRSYDARGRLSHVADTAGGDADFSYDAVGRLTGNSNQVGSLQYTYDKASRLTSRQVAGESMLTYAYDNAGNLTSAALPQASASFTYDALNRTSKISRANGVSSQYSFDTAGELLSIVDSGGMGISNTHSYTYDPAGNRSVHSTNLAQPLVTQAATSTYDNTNRLTATVDQTGATVYTYDANGNLATSTGPSGATTYAWDGRNHLKSIAALSETDSFTYDFAGNLISENRSGSSVNLTQTFVLDPLTNVASIGQSNGDNLSVLSGDSIDQHLAVIHSAGQVEYGLIDVLNTTTATTDQNGKQLASIFYEPFGRTSSTSTYPFMFTGRTPANTESYFYRTRFQNADAARFISEDSLGYVDGPNLYSYVRNNPIGFNDPTGQFEFLIPVAIIAAYVWVHPETAEEAITFVEDVVSGISPLPPGNWTQAFLSTVGQLDGGFPYTPRWPMASPDHFYPGPPILTTRGAMLQANQQYSCPYISGGNQSLRGRPSH